jgi:hypothetical protein
VCRQYCALAHSNQLRMGHSAEWCECPSCGTRAADAPVRPREEPRIPTLAGRHRVTKNAVQFGSPKLRTPQTGRPNTREIPPAKRACLVVANRRGLKSLSFAISSLNLFECSDIAEHCPCLLLHEIWDPRSPPPRSSLWHPPRLPCDWIWPYRFAAMASRSLLPV